MAVVSSKAQALNDIFKLLKFRYSEVRYFQKSTKWPERPEGFYGLIEEDWVYLASSYEECLRELRHHFDMLEGFQVTILEEILRSVKL